METTLTLYFLALLIYPFFFSCCARFRVHLLFSVLISNSVFVSGAPSSLGLIRSVIFIRIISCCKKGMIVLVSDISIVGKNLKWCRRTGVAFTYGNTDSIGIICSIGF